MTRLKLIILHDAGLVLQFNNRASRLKGRKYKLRYLIKLFITIFESTHLLLVQSMSGTVYYVIDVDSAESLQ